VGDKRNPWRPKVKAGAQGGAASTVAAAVLAWILRMVGVDVEDVPPEVLIVVGGGLATALGTLAAYVKRDGLRGAWERLVNGDRAGIVHPPH
jgi:hypothetical protein